MKRIVFLFFFTIALLNVCNAQQGIDSLNSTQDTIYLLPDTVKTTYNIVVYEEYSIWESMLLEPTEFFVGFSSSIAMSINKYETLPFQTSSYSSVNCNIIKQPLYTKFGIGYQYLEKLNYYYTWQTIERYETIDTSYTFLGSYEQTVNNAVQTVYIYDTVYSDATKYRSKDSIKYQANKYAYINIPLVIGINAQVRKSMFGIGFGTMLSIARPFPQNKLFNSDTNILIEEKSVLKPKSYFVTDIYTRQELSKILWVSENISFYTPFKNTGKGKKVGINLGVSIQFKI